MMNYCRFIEVLVAHEYYKGCCSSFYFVPSKATQDEMRRQGLLIHESRGCLRVAAQEDSCVSEPLYFGAYTKNMDLWNVTMLERAASQKVPVFSFEKGNASLNYEKLGSECKSLEIPGLMFLVKLNSADLMNGGRMKIPLKTRCCKWRYCIQGDFSQFDVKIYAVDDGDCASFDEERSADNLVTFTSKEKIPIVYGDSPKFQLRTKDTSRVLMKSLPNMNSKSLSRIEIEGGGYEIVAESFINL